MREPSESPGARVAVHGLVTVGTAGYWWQDAESGAHLLRGDATGVRVCDVPAGPAGLTPLTVHPADAGPPVVLYGRPGGDYGYLSDPGAPDTVLARRPSLVHLARVPSATGGTAGPGFVYTGFAPGARLDDPPVDGLRVAVHRTGEPFAHDRAVDLDDGPLPLVTVEATGDPTAVLVRSTAHGVTTQRLLRLDPATGRSLLTPLPAAATPRTRLVLGADRWWHGEALGTPRAVLRAGLPGNAEAGETVVFPEGTALAWIWGTRRSLLVRTVAGRGAQAAEALYRVDGDTQEARLVAGGRPGDSFPEVAASPAADCALWLRVSRRPDGAAVGRTELLPDEEERARPLSATPWPAALPRTTRYCTAGDGNQVPVQLSGTAGPVLLLEHGGLTALANAPLERALEELARSGQLTLARAVTRSLVPAHRASGGERGYNDLLHAARLLREECGPQRPLLVLGHSMGAVGAARAVLLEPGLFDGWILRFPVTDLVGFPHLGIGRHWTGMLGDPSRTDQLSALTALSPLHLPLPADPLPPVLIQTGTYDTRADARHGLRLADRLRERASVTLSSYPVGHVERFCQAASRRAVAEVTAFVRGCPAVANDLEGAPQ
ncbi:alpha/beta hydrolase family protein [Actinacidiphila acidipaludis]|uniref:Prolyl oligopeptidase family serine peptidase n=1 Tax=Actinacidiphila acidipaludis TaxID=2873382 RepID=A0ABS7QFU0_9ACTN|nr:prolyl oligopeptidase family serine peptidase [Streptomyces acidipaludis]MBY8882037.1 prolyl oligopeptidase family serine peptidase [Streptomyces acidipaludis]